MVMLLHHLYIDESDKNVLKQKEEKLLQYQETTGGRFMSIFKIEFK